jgi:hypothetical protein
MHWNPLWPAGIEKKNLTKKKVFTHFCSYPSNLATKINAATPLKVFNILDSTLYHVFIAASPMSLTAAGRLDDLTAIVRIIDKAEKVSKISSFFPYLFLPFF